MDPANNNEDAAKTDGPSEIQRQLAEYRKRMSIKKQQSNTNQLTNETPGVTEKLISPAQSPLSGQPSQANGQLLINMSTSQRTYQHNPDANLDGAADKDDGEAGDLNIDVYVPPQLGNNDGAGAPGPTLIKSDLSKETQPLLLASRESNMSIVSISKMPILNVIDLTRTSINARRLRMGTISQPQDLESEIVPDHKLKEQDLAALEREVNKKKRKRAKALQKGEMNTPMSPQVRNSQPAEQRQNNVDADADMEQAVNDQMMVDQLVNNPVQAELNRNNNRADRVFLGGLFRIHGNSHLDICCLKDMHPDFIYMLLLVIGITACLTIFAVFS